MTARIGAALRTASRSAAHTAARPRLSGLQRAGLVAGAAAVIAGLVVGAIALNRAPEPAFPAGPTASRITAPGPDHGFPLSDAEVLALLDRAPDLGALSEPARRGACLTGLGYAPDVDILGGTRLQMAGRPAVVLVLDGAIPSQFSAVVVPATCNAAHTGLLAETAVARP
ncbi:hypothetical protein C6A87_029065 [Mycobacterium sp. ITM-2016-00317]|uniref:hypothetical protein n=1 Tax=Mycobacterium sp. ITM-2016-00317 TaxID=2099694 RepID=UPI00287F8D3A|nr:hypothetical protein [Mycobacterium sp. ITM-2016-00317]WNG87715.1 hypothetical protein C6A87_029065 [Mycobacterium sp. ITM-2016-00317]